MAPGTVGTRPFSPGPFGTTSFSCLSSLSQDAIRARNFSSCKTTGASCGQLGWDLGTLAPLRPQGCAHSLPRCPRALLGNWVTRKARRGEAMDPPHSLRKLSSLVTPLGNRHSVTLSEQGGWRRQDDLQRSLPTSQPQPTQLWVRGRGEDTNLSAELLYGIM